MKRDRLTPAFLSCAVACAIATSAFAQEDGLDLRQGLVDLEGLIIAGSATTRCAIYDDDLAYLTPLEAVAVDLRIEQISRALSEHVDDLADRKAWMRERANALVCGAAALEPYLTYARGTARDITDVALAAWAGIEVEKCAYFADDDFMAAVDRAHQRAADLAPEENRPRARYLAQGADYWISVFEQNCYNLAFDPMTTLPGQIALALPTG